MTQVQRRRLVDALEHDTRQPQHAAEMGMRNLSLFVAELASAVKAGSKESVLAGDIKAETSSLREALSQILKRQRDLLDAIRLEFGEGEISPGTIVAHELIERALKANRVLAGPIELRGAHSRLRFVSDERKVERILNNLITNALWHSGGSKVLFGVRERDGDVVLEVRDNGRGIGAQKLARLFGSEVPATSQMLECAESGAGLGLYIVRLFSERLGGTTACTSVPDRGTLFRVKLPGPLTRSATQALHRCRITRATAESKFVVMLDDDVAALRDAEAAFQLRGVEVYADHDPLRWLGVVTDLKRAPDLVLLGWRCQDGHSTLHLDIVRRKWSDLSPRVIVLSRRMSSKQIEGLSKVVPVLLKPVSPAQFEFLVSSLLSGFELPSKGIL